MPPQLRRSADDPASRPSRSVREPATAVPPLGNARRILLCLRWGIGDLVMELPLLRALRRAAPAAEITAFGASPAIELLDHDDSVDRVVSVQSFDLAHWGDMGSEAVRAAVADWCRARQFDCILDASHAPLGARMALEGLGLARMDTAHYRFGADDHGDGSALLCRAAEQRWGVPVERRPPRLTLRREEQAPAERVRRELAGAAPLVAVAPIASSALKRARPSEFARAADALVERHDCRVLVFGGHGNPDSARVLAAMRHARRAHMVAPVHLRFTAALLQQCRVLVCNDTGLMHLAAAVGARVVGVFACTSPELYLPPQGTVVHRWKMPCRFPEAEQNRFGMSPCTAADRCLDPGHQRVERWADAAVAAASAVLGEAEATGSERRR